jgi:hypothetical protein
MTSLFAAGSYERATHIACGTPPVPDVSAIIRPQRGLHAMVAPTSRRCVCEGVDGAYRDRRRRPARILAMTTAGRQPVDSRPIYTEMDPGISLHWMIRAAMPGIAVGDAAITRAPAGRLPAIHARRSCSIEGALRSSSTL